jgi:hypothetical protein
MLFSARMPVPKMAKNGFNSVSQVRVSLKGLDLTWKSGMGMKTKRGIKTIFDRARARFLLILRRTMTKIAETADATAT